MDRPAALGLAIYLQPMRRPAVATSSPATAAPARARCSGRLSCHRVSTVHCDPVASHARDLDDGKPVGGAEQPYKY